MDSPNIIVMACPGRDAEPLATQLFLQGAQVVIVEDRERKGALCNALAAFRVGLELGGPVTIFQDDTEVVKNFVPYYRQYLWHVEQQSLIIQWFCNGQNFNDTWGVEKGLLVGRTADKFLSTQAVTYSRRWAQRIYEWLQQAARTAVPDDLGRLHGDDMHIQNCLKTYDKTYPKQDGHPSFHIHVPNLVQHVGEQSLVGPGITLYDGFRQSKCYPGKGFDAMRLQLVEPWSYQPPTT